MMRPSPVLEIQRRDQVVRRAARSCTGSTSRSHEHEAVAVIGASGSGKSTLLRCVDLLEEIDDGDIFLDGEVITDPSVDAVAVRRRLGFVFQAYNLFPHLTVLENVVLGIGQGPRRPARRGRGRRRGPSSSGSGSAGREDDQPDGSRAASSSGSRSRARSPPGRGRCCSTRSPARSTPSSSARCCRRCATLQGRGGDDADRHPRDELRPRGRRHASASCTRAGSLEVGPPEQVLETPRSRRRSDSCAGCWRRGGRSCGS